MKVQHPMKVQHRKVYGPKEQDPEVYGRKVYRLTTVCPVLRVHKAGVMAGGARGARVMGGAGVMAGSQDKTCSVVSCRVVCVCSVVSCRVV